MILKLCWGVLIFTTVTNNVFAKDINFKVSVDIRDDDKVTAAPIQTPNNNCIPQKQYGGNEPEKIELEIKPNLEEVIQKLSNLTQNLQTSIDELNQHHELVNKTTTKSEEDTFKHCFASVKDQLNIKDFVGNESPEADDLDSYMKRHMECEYSGLQVMQYRTFNTQHFNGHVYETHFAIRAPGRVVINLAWRDFDAEDYLVYIDNYDFTLEQVFRYSSNVLARKNYSNKILSTDHYQKFYLKLKNGNLTFGRGCDQEPIFTRKILINSDEEVKLNFGSISFYGAKLLFNCAH